MEDKPGIVWCETFDDEKFKPGSLIHITFDGDTDVYWQPKEECDILAFITKVKPFQIEIVRVNKHGNIYEEVLHLEQYVDDQAFELEVIEEG